ncbi:hypothetical protein MANI_016914 [Metarhizium anisopliae]|nr:hypothetical protein MANI_016914 [Metarhizium anisopliae]
MPIRFSATIGLRSEFDRLSSLGRGGDASDADGQVHTQQMQVPRPCFSHVRGTCSAIAHTSGPTQGATPPEPTRGSPAKRPSLGPAQLFTELWELPMLQRPFAGRRRACSLQPATPLPTGLADLDMDTPSRDMTD